ncbi:MAG: thioredoxin family protein [Planctomycetes bacterium]|jgi:peroxiredoxin|nr:thioredoxin family protein [Planctomycetota bacterium]MCP4839276.1 thioredoxin family protein [Planctomycetota bacterium]
MAETPSTMTPLGRIMPVFELPDASGVLHTSASLSGERGTLIVFLCNHCPYVVHVADELGRLGVEYCNRGIGVAGINSNDASKYAADAPARMPIFAQTHGITFPYLFDETQSTAKSFGASCTPDFFLFDPDGRLVYRGQLDSSRPNNDIPVTGSHLRLAMDALIGDDLISEDQAPSLGCNIKWKQYNCCSESQSS